MSTPASDDAPPVLIARDGALLRVTINRPEKRNALSRPTLAALRAAFEDTAGDDGIRVAVLTAAGDRSFAAGGDLRDLSSVRTLDEATDMADATKQALDAVRRYPVPVVAAVNGDALGGGAELSVAADMRVMAAHARIGFIQGRLAITTAWGGSADLLRLVGPARALRLLSRGEIVDADTAVSLGLADARAEPDETLDAAVARFVAPMLAQTRPVLAGFKALALEHRSAHRDPLDRLETRVFAGTWVHDDHWRAADALLGKARPAAS